MADMKKVDNDLIISTCTQAFFLSFRYAGPYDYNRVVLKEGINGQDYIDASQISDSGNIVIATQCPLQTTIAHFLQMLTDQKIDSIVMLTKTYEQRLGNMILKI